jgi:hypothetical protein
MNDLLMSAERVVPNTVIDGQNGTFSVLPRDGSIKLPTTRSGGVMPVRIKPPRADNFYIMPCVGAGHIPLSWLDTGRGLGSGAACCEFDPVKLGRFAEALTTRGFTFEHRIDSAKSAPIPKEGEALDAPVANASSKPIHFATMVKAGTNGRPDTRVYLFQGDAREVLADRQFRDVVSAQHGKPVVGVENLPWGARQKIKEKTMSSVGTEILGGTLAHTSPGARSVFILDRTQLSSAARKATVQTIWRHGTLARTFPMPTTTFAPAAKASASIFVVRTFEAAQKQAYDAVLHKAGPQNEPVVRYLCGLLSSEDMRWSTLQKDDRLLTDANQHAQNHVLSENFEKCRPADRKGNGKAPLLQFEGRLTTDFANRVDEERYAHVGEQVLDKMYSNYLAAWDVVARSPKEASHEQIERLRDTQTDLVHALSTFTGRDTDGNVVYSGTADQNQQNQAWNATKESMSGPDFVQGFNNGRRQIERQMREAALVHRVHVPAFVNFELARLNQMSGTELQKHLAQYSVDVNGGINGPNETRAGLLHQTFKAL